jgi:hypothetical protein
MYIIAPAVECMLLIEKGFAGIVEKNSDVKGPAIKANGVFYRKTLSVSVCSLQS